jgi:hypothetical protein
MVLNDFAVGLFVDCFCGLVVPDCRPRGPRFGKVGLEQGPLRLVRINEELLERRSSSSSLEN